MSPQARNEQQNIVNNDQNAGMLPQTTGNQQNIINNDQIALLERKLAILKSLIELKENTNNSLKLSHSEEIKNIKFLNSEETKNIKSLNLEEIQRIKVEKDHYKNLLNDYLGLE